MGLKYYCPVSENLNSLIVVDFFYRMDNLGWMDGWMDGTPPLILANEKLFECESKVLQSWKPEEPQTNAGAGKIFITTQKIFSSGTIKGIITSPNSNSTGM